MAYRWTQEAWTAWRQNNAQLTQRGFTLAVIVTRDGTLEHWVTRGKQRWRNDPCWPLIETERLEHQQ